MKRSPFLALLPILALLPRTAHSAAITWTGGGLDANLATSGNWSSGPTDGDSLTFGTGFASGTTLNNNFFLSVAGLTFNTTLSAPLTIQGNAFTLTTGITNNNTTTGRNVTIDNDILISGAQSWSTAVDVDAVTILNGDLTGTGNISIGTAVQSNGTNLPTLRLGGSNSGYSGTITPGTDTGILLLSPSAQTGGLVDLNSSNRNLWLTSNSSANPYTFWTGNSTPSGGNPMNVNFRNAGTSGLFLTGGDVYWNPTSSGNHYVWDASRAGSQGEIRFNGSNDTVGNPPTPVPDSALVQPRTWYFGNSSGSLVLGGNRSITNGAGGANPARVVMDFALSDDGTARNFTTSASLLVLTRAAGGGPGTPALSGNTVVTGGALALTNMDRIFNGWLNLNGGVMLLDGVSWGDFMSDRSAGWHGSGAANAWAINSGNSGFAARATPINIFISSNAADSYGTITAGGVFNRDFTIGSGVRADDKSLYANAAVTISQDTVLTGARVIKVAGGNRESAANWTIQGPVHEFSGAISGAFGLTIGGTSTTGGGTLRLSNASNSFSSLSINPSGQAGGVVVLATDDGVLGSGTVTVGTGAQGQAGLLLFENQTGTQKTFAKNLAMAHGADNSSGEAGFGSWAGDVLYTGTVTITSTNRATQPVQVQAGKFSFGSGSSITNNSTVAGVWTYSKGGAGELVLDANATYAGTKADLAWALRQGTLTTAQAGILINGTATFDGDNLIGGDGVTWPTNTGGLGGLIPVSRTWKVTTVDQSYTSAAMAYAGYTTVDVETGRTLTLSTGANPTSPSEAGGNSTSTPRWDLVKTGGGTWVFSNTDLATPASSGPQDGAGFIRIDQGTLDITGDYGRGSLSVNGGTLLSGSFSPFTYSASAAQFAIGVGQTNLLEVTTAGGKIGISASGSGDVTRTVGFYWDQSGSSTLTLAARDDRNLVFSAASFPDVQAGNTLAIARDGSGSGKVQINDTAVTVTGTLRGTSTLQLGASGNGVLTMTGVMAPGASIGTLTVANDVKWNGAATAGSSTDWQFELGVGNSADLLAITGANSDFLKDTSAGSVFRFNFMGSSDTGTFTLVDWDSTASLGGGADGTSFELTDFSYTNLGGGNTGSFSFAGTSLVFTAVAVPEPRAAFLGGLGLLALLRRRNR